MRRQIWFSLLGVFCAGLLGVTAWGQGGGGLWQQYAEAGQDAFRDGNATEAERLFRNALEESQKFELYDLRRSTSCNLLANLYLNLGRYAEAEPMYKQALNILQTRLGEQHVVLVPTLRNMGVMYRVQKRWAEAEPLSERSVSILEKTYGADDPRVASELNEMAIVYGAQGKYAEALKALERALKVDEKASGAELAVARDLNNLAATYHSQGKFAQAEPLYARALGLMEKALGPDHPGLVAGLENYALLLRKSGREPEAQAAEARAQALRAKITPSGTGQ